MADVVEIDEFDILSEEGKTATVVVSESSTILCSEGEIAMTVEVENYGVLASEEEGATVVETTESTDILALAEQGPRGIPGPAGATGGAILVKIGPEPLSGHSAVAYRPDGALQYADCSNPDHFGAVLGVLESAYAAGDDAEVRQSYAITHEGWSWTPGPVFVGKSGGLVQEVPSDAVFIQVIGYAQAATMLNINPQPPIYIA